MTEARRESLLWAAQRASAAVLALGMAAHLAGMVYAVRGGLTAAEILSRTQGNGLLALAYGTFVLAVAIHAPIGLRTILVEWAGWRGRAADTTAAATALVLLALGLRAVWAVTA